MVEQCCVDGCLSAKEDITYFKLPISRTLRRKWLDAIRSPFKLTDDAVVCSSHFLEDHYMTVRGKRRLKPKVVPCVFHEKINDNKDNEEATDKDKGENIDNKDESRVDKTDSTSNDNSNGAIDKVAKISDAIDNENEDNRVIEDSIDNRKGEDLKENNEDPKSPQNCAQRTQEVEFSPNKDIEDIITNYQIKQTIPLSQIGGGRAPAPLEGDAIDVERDDTSYVEVAVAGKGQERDEDCLMLLEDVQVEVDPSLFEQDEHETKIEQVDLDMESNSDVIDLGERHELPISLLSSSDEDDVIIQEPKIDTIEVSDATDEDDIPLLKLAKKHKKSKKKAKRSQKSKAISKIMSYSKYQCYHCKFITNDTADYEYHVASHSNVLHCCESCSYTTSSKLLLARHRDKHAKEKKNKDKRFKCPLCNYRAKHNMSLVYHMSTHEAKSAFECEKCGFFTNTKELVLEHLQSCGKAFRCNHCTFTTKWKGALKRHLVSMHPDDQVVDGDYVPTGWS
ncbi:zinc finger protein 711-like [Zerene cesonia]|uniref:zinc finger protein 711-like n=1 Tax=Zerene cesonia TaxID=33412 RepID=UPI0018E50B4E|nr:zinc finger protein 711-like [Zerene cesonia]